MILLTPGPANTTRSVKEAMVVEDICHREHVFTELLASIRRDLLRLLGAEATHDVVLFTGSGTCAVEAAVASCVPEGGRLLVLDNGSYGARMARIAETFRVPFEAMELPWDERPDPARVVDRLRGGGFTHLAMVHHETSTGLLNPLPELAESCRGLGVTLIADTISSFAGIPVPPVDVCVASANKCLQGMPGLAFLFVRRDLLPRCARRSFYTSVADEHATVERTGQMRFTPAVQVAYALRRALDETIEETLPVRFSRYRANWESLVRGMIGRGFRKLLRDPAESGLLTSFLKPTTPAYDFGRHHDLLYADGFTIYPAMAGFDHTFRLGNIGQITPREIEAFLAAQDRVFTRMAVRAPFYR